MMMKKAEETKIGGKFVETAFTVAENTLLLGC
jgi:hypothetical protein